MLKTNSKKARENIREYITENFDGSNYGIETPATFEGIARRIMGTFRAEKFSIESEKRYYHYNEQAAFTDWCAGLPSILDTCYYYNRSAVDDLGAILEETEEEKKKYSEDDAEKMLTRLIYRELCRVQ